MPQPQANRVSSPVIVALDFNDRRACDALVAQLDPSQCRLKIGKEMFTLYGPALVEQLQQRGFEIFLDLKFHDIPATVAKAVVAAANLGVWMVNVHATGGRRMLSDAAEALAGCAHKPLLIGVTVLTSMNDSDLRAVGVERSAAEQVLHLAMLSKECGLDGVVCSAQEAGMLKKACGTAFKSVTPGIRPVGSDAQDQTRVMTPREALAAGSDFLVIGRPITTASDPAGACRAIISSLS